MDNKEIDYSCIIDGCETINKSPRKKCPYHLKLARQKKQFEKQKNKVFTNKEKVEKYLSPEVQNLKDARIKRKQVKEKLTNEQKFRKKIEQLKNKKPTKNKTSKKKTELEKWKDKLDEICRKFVRKRDIHEDWFCCCTCKNHFKRIDGEVGHFIRRGILILRWDLKNIHFQCIACNREKRGNEKEYEKFIINTYGKEVLETIIKLSKKTIKYSVDDLKNLYTFIEEELLKL